MAELTSPTTLDDAAQLAALRQILDGASALAGSDVPHLRMLGVRVTSLTRSLLDSAVATDL